MADTKRDKAMRSVGMLKAVEALLKSVRSDADYADKRTLDLLEVTQQALGKTLLSLWERADAEAGE